MPDPISISTAVVAFLQVTGNVAWQLKKFHDGASVVQQTILDLSNGVAGLHRVLEAMRDAFQHVSAEQETGHAGSLWKNVARAVVEGREILDQLHTLLQGIDRDTKHLNEHRKQLRLTLAEDKISRFRQDVDTYRDSLQLSMQAIILINQVTQNRTGHDEILPSLSELRNDIRAIALDMGARIETLQAVVQSSRDEGHLHAMKSLQECVRSAASTISSATTILSLSADDDLDSAFGDLFPSKDSLAIREWMQTIASAPSDATSFQLQPPLSVADVRSLNDEDAADSDNELEGEMTRLLWQSGMQKLQVGNKLRAERLLRNCLTRLSAVRSKALPYDFRLRLDTMQALYTIYHAWKNWGQCQDIILQRMSINEMAHGRQDPSYLTDVLEFAKLARKQHDNTTARTQAMVALKGYWKLRNAEESRVCLDFLVTISEADGNEDDRDAYSIMLDTLSVGTSWPSTITTSHNHSVTRSDESPSRRHDSGLRVEGNEFSHTTPVPNARRELDRYPLGLSSMSDASRHATSQVTATRSLASQSADTRKISSDEFPSANEYLYLISTESGSGGKSRETEARRSDDDAMARQRPGNEDDPEAVLLEQDPVQLQDTIVSEEEKLLKRQRRHAHASTWVEEIQEALRAVTDRNANGLGPSGESNLNVSISLEPLENLPPYQPREKLGSESISLSQSYNLQASPSRIAREQDSTALQKMYWRLKKRNPEK